MLSAGMERIRRDLIQRAHAQRSDAMERGSVGHEPAQSSNIEDVGQQGERRTLGLAGFLSRPVGLVRQPVAVAGDSRHRPETPKSPQRSTLANEIHEGLESRAAHAERPGPEITEPSPAVVMEANSQTQDVQTQPRPQDSHRSRRRGVFDKVRGDRRKRFLFCLPWVNSGRVRVALMHCLTSGLFVLLLLAVCKLPLCLAHTLNMN